MKKLDKWMAISIVGAIVIIAFWFLPAFSVNGESVNLFTALMENQVTFGFVGICGIIGMVLTVVAGFKKDRRAALTGSILSAIVTVSMLGTLAETLARAGLDMYESTGFGLYIAIIGSIVNIVLAAKCKKEQQ